MKERCATFAGLMQKHALLVLIASLSGVCMASVSTNVPIRHWSYTFIEQMSDYGLVDSALLSTKPISRLEMARLIIEAQQNIQDCNERNPYILTNLTRLEKEFSWEIDRLQLLRGLGTSGAVIKPIEDPYMRFLYADEPPEIENQQGDVFKKGSNQRYGFATRGVLFDTMAFYLHPEYRQGYVEDGPWELVEGYGKFAWGNLDILAGKDSLWWGPGYYGSLIMSTNAEPFTMVKVENARPILLPWIFKYLGPLRSTFFLTKLEKDRDKPEARLSGLRMDFKPLPNVEVGLSRTVMFGGEGNADIDYRDYLQIFWPKNIQGEENQLAGFDVDWRINMPRPIPTRSLNLYGEFTGEDAAGFHEFRPLLGVKLNDLLRKGRTDLRVEYAKTYIGRWPGVFYTHGIFKSGYTYEGRVIGHHIGTDARDVFVRLTHYVRPNLILGLDFDRQTGLGVNPRPQTDQTGIDLLWFGPRHIQLQFRYRYECSTLGSVFTGKNHIADLCLVYDF